MSGTLNPLAAQGPPAGPGDNALGTAPMPAATPQPGQAPSVGDALSQIQGASPSPQQMLAGIQRANYLVKELASLVHSPDVTRKDVLKATSDAVGTRHISAEEGIKFLAQMPENPDHLRPWLQQMYQTFLVGAVAAHAHAHGMVTNG